MLTELLSVAEAVARACGQLIVEQRPAIVDVAATKSSEVDIVTIMDELSEQLAYTMIGELRPDDGILGEEGVDKVGTSGITWVVDPIDGTVNYLYEIPAYAVSVAAVTGDPRSANWRPLVGVVYNPAIDELFLAAEGRGARLVTAQGEVALSAKQPRPLAQSLIATGFAYRSEDRRWQGAAVADLLPRVRDIRRAGSAALDLCNVAAGRVDAYYESGLNAWDYGAGWLIATEAGHMVRGLDDVPTKELTIAGPAEHCAELAALVRAHRPA